MALRHNPDAYSHSISSLASAPLSTPTSRRCPNYYINSCNDQNRYRSNAYSPFLYRSNENDETMRPYSSRCSASCNTRACSYDSLLDERNRYQPPTSASRDINQYRRPQQQSIRPNQCYDYDDNLTVKSTDLPAGTEQEMIDLVLAGFRKYETFNQRELAGFLKRAADQKFAPCWHCIVGRQFSSYVTHEMNGFIYFTKGPLSILLFKSGA